MKKVALLLSTFLLACSGRLDVGEDARADDPTGTRGAAGPTGANPMALTGSVALGTGHGCAILQDRSVACWGFNAAGQTGASQADSTPGSDGQHYVALPRRVPGLSNIVQLTADWQTSCALDGSGSVYCWGAAKNALAPGATDAGEIPSRVAGLDHVVEVRSGGGPACARKSDGSVWCWGKNDYRSVGPSTAPASSGSPMNEILPPTRVPGINAASIAVSDSLSCAVHVGSGEVSCWGRVEIDTDIYVPDSEVPRVIPGVRGVKQLALAQAAAVALLDDGSVMVWGGGGGDKGILTLAAKPTDPHITDIDHQAVAPVAFPGLGKGQIVAVAAQYHTICALRVDGAPLCWGDNYGGELGTGHTTDVPRYSPTEVEGVTPAHGLTVGTWNSCARRATGELVCWGGSFDGALGNGDPAPRSAAKPGKPVLLPMSLIDS